MMKDSVIFIEHIIDCIVQIRTYTKGVSHADFMSNRMIQDAVIRNFEVIGEATKKVDETVKIKFPNIEWKKIAGMRDKLIHNYMGVDLWAVWKVVEDILPDLETDIRKILDRESGL